MDVDRYPEGLVEGFHLVALIERLHRRARRGSAGCTAAAASTRSGSSARPRRRADAGPRLGGLGRPVDGGLVVELDTTVEVEGRSKPGFVVRWRQLMAAEPKSRPLRAPAARGRRTACRGDRAVRRVPDDGRADLPQRLARRRARPADAFAFAASAVGDPRGRRGPRHPLGAASRHAAGPPGQPGRPSSGDAWFGWNYGLDDVRFGHRCARGSGSASRAGGGRRARGDAHLVRLDCALEIEGRSEPALHCQWLALWLPETDASGRDRCLTS